MEMETKRSSVGVEVTEEIVPEHSTKLLRCQNVGAGRDQVTTWQSLVILWIVSSVQLIDDHLPNRVTSGWASLGVAMALVWHSVVQCVWPDWHPTQWCGNGCVVDKELVSHHFKLLVSTNTKVGSSHTND